MNALEHHGLNYARQLGFFRRDHLNVLGTDNDINGLVGVKALVHAFKAASRELYHAVLGHTAVDDVALADEVGNEGVDRLVVNVRRGAYLLDIAVVHDNDAVAHGEGFLLIVGNVDEGQLQLLLYAAELYLHLLSQLQVKSPQRLVKEQHLGVIHQSAGNGDTLLLTSRKTVYGTLLKAHKVHQLKHFAYALHYLLFGSVLHAESEGDVLIDVEVGEKCISLEYGVDVALVGRNSVYALAVEKHVSAGGLKKACDYAESGGLSAARRPEKGNELLILDVETDIFEDTLALLKFHDNIL